MKPSKFCCFYVNDVHLVTMLLPYINEKIKEKREFITIFETDISESAKKVIKSISLKKKDEQNFLKIGWEKTDVVPHIQKDGQYVLVMGSNAFMKKVNETLEAQTGNFVIINCFEVFQAEKIIDDIIQNHEKMLNSKGEHAIEKIFTQCTKKNNKKITIIQ